jgi:hypothetical protein
MSAKLWGQVISKNERGMRWSEDRPGPDWYEFKEPCEPDDPFEIVDGVAVATKRTAPTLSVAQKIRMLYSVDEELALVNKGIADAKDPEYVAYRAAVAEVRKETGA